MTEHVHGKRWVAEFRADYSRWPRDSSMQSLVDALTSDSPLFASYWRAQSVLHREGGERQFQHPVLGTVFYTQTTLLVALQPDCKLVCLVPAKKPVHPTATDPALAERSL